eukprot:2135446-Prorocentrum_lima.AAC.1
MEMNRIMHVVHVFVSLGGGDACPSYQMNRCIPRQRCMSSHRPSIWTPRNRASFPSDPKYSSTTATCPLY